MRRRDAAAIIALLAVLIATGQPAQADPVYPSKNDVRQAQQHARAVRSRVTQLEHQLTRAAASVDAADLALSTAAEDFDAAQVELDRSRQAAMAATAVANTARQKLDGAQQQVGQLAAQTYRSGGSLASLDVLLSPGGPDDVLARASMIHTLATQRQHTVQQMDAARVVATTLDQQAAEAVAQQTAAAQKLARARATAQQRSAAARSTLAAEQATKKTLLVKLAAAQQTTVTVERARQAGLARAAALRQAAAGARAAAARSAQQRRYQAPPGSGGGGGGGATDPGSTDPGGGSSSGSSSGGDSAVAWARGRVGLPYQWGGAGPGSYDCSGLIMRAWQQAGVALPHSSRIQYQQVAKISYAALRPGDLVFFATDPSNANTIHHVAMYIGGGQMIEAPYTGADVRIVALRRGDSMPYAGRP